MLIIQIPIRLFHMNNNQLFFRLLNTKRRRQLTLPISTGSNLVPGFASPANPLTRSVSIRPSMMMWATWTPFGPNSRAKDCGVGDDEGSRTKGRVRCEVMLSACRIGMTRIITNLRECTSSEFGGSHRSKFGSSAYDAQHDVSSDEARTCRRCATYEYSWLRRRRATFHLIPAPI